MKSVYRVAAAAVLLGGTGAIAAAADYFLKIGSVAAWTGVGPIDLKVQGSGDSDGDGVVDAGTLRLVCSRGILTSATFQQEIGVPTGKAAAAAPARRWKSAPPELARHLPSYDLATLKGGRQAADAGGWVPVTLTGADGLCPAAAAAAEKVCCATKSRPNIQNN